MSCQKLSRRYLNLVLRGGHGFYSMCRKDVSELFYASTAQAETASSEEVKVKKTSIERLPRRRGKYEVEASMSHSWMNVFAPLGRNNILCADSAGNATMYNTVLNTFMSMPTLNSPKGPRYIALSVPHTDVNVDINPEEDPNFFTDKFHCEHTNNLYILDMVPGNGKPCCFEVLARYPHGDLRWHALPSPPFFHNNPHYEPLDNVPFAVVDNTWIFMSTSDKTFSFDTVTCLWSQVGDWVMPFHDKAEYVPELGLWLGLLASSPYTLCAVDLLDAGTGSPPTVQHIQLDLDLDWSLVDQTLLKVGPGMFCVAKFYNIVCEQDDYCDLRVVVFTGVEVVQCADHQRKWRPRRLRAIKHKSQCHLAESIVQLL